ncbi:MAG TPA: D-alanyl-D-alanine carboxypeptidase/D-alanyl-D-alanine-endopeptidase [Planctomycetota bacterium]|nr:D-alanyl-D-alanine carboxypeptidase/D-alanyl-D-alanine-endopeptidase [Planctomycetota bacterium]
MGAQSRVVAVLSLSALALAAGPPSVGAAAPSIADAVDSLVAGSGLKPETVSVAVVDPSNGAVLGSHRGSEPMMPASCLKVATTAAAMAVLGPDHELRTLLLAQPPSRGAPGVVPGDLWLVGRGDPGLSEHGPEGSTTAALDAFAGLAAARGVRAVSGDLVFDASWFDGPRVHPSWVDAGASARWFAAEIDALTVNDACVDVTVEPGSGPGAPGRVSIFPQTALVDLENRTSTTALRKEHGFGFRLAGESNSLEVNGKVWTKSNGATSPAAIRDPALLCAEQVGRALARAGIRVQGVVRRAREGEAPPRDAALLASHATTVRHACAVANTRSQNLWAETLMRALGAERAGEGSFVRGAREVRVALAPAGLEVASTLFPVDGSGLSRDNRASAVALAKVLALMHRSPHRDAFFSGLARPGTGTLDDRFTGRGWERRVFAKTGTLRGVSGLAGLVLAADGTPRVFAVLGERVDVGRCRRLQDRVVEVLAGEPPRALRR